MKFIKTLLLSTVALLVILWSMVFISVQFESYQHATVTPVQKQAARDYLDGKITAPPAAWNWQRVEAAPGVVLRGGFIAADNSKGTIIVVPGFTGSIEMLMREIVQFHQAGYSVASIEYRGQGDSYRPLHNPEKGYVEDYRLLAGEVANFAESVRDANKPLFFYSISKGGHITMRMAAEQALDVAAYALMVPMIKINTGTLAYATVRRMTTVLNALGLGKMYAPGQSGYTPEEYGVATPCNSNPDTAQSQGAIFALNANLRSRGSTVKWLYETFRSTDKLLDADYVAKITQPVMLFTAGNDHLVDSDAAGQFCASLHNCQRIHIDSAGHCITRENFALYDDLVDQAISHFNSIGR